MLWTRRLRSVVARCARSAALPRTWIPQGESTSLAAPATSAAVGTLEGKAPAAQQRDQFDLAYDAVGDGALCALGGAAAVWQTQDESTALAAPATSAAVYTFEEKVPAVEQREKLGVACEAHGGGELCAVGGAVAIVQIQGESTAHCAGGERGSRHSRGGDTGVAAGG